MLPEFIHEWLISKGYKQDTYGHFQKLNGQDLYRFKIQDNSLRYEKQITFSDGKHEWMRIKSGYYKDLSITDEGKIKGLK